jgi:hypothetical protein
MLGEGYVVGLRCVSDEAVDQALALDGCT